MGERDCGTTERQRGAEESTTSCSSFLRQPCDVHAAWSCRALPLERNGDDNPAGSWTDNFPPSHLASHIHSWVPTLAIWGGAAGGAVFLFASSIPLFKTDVIAKIPLLRNYYEGE